MILTRIDKLKVNMNLVDKRSHGALEAPILGGDPSPDRIGLFKPLLGCESFVSNFIVDASPLARKT